MHTQSRSLSVADTAKLVRKALRAEFPGVKFSVRSNSYAGGASIDVMWTDGPRDVDVQGVVSLYRGAYFDGMTDCKHYVRSLLTTEDGAEEVRFGADYIFTTRDISRGRQALYFAELRRFVLAQTGERLPLDPQMWRSISIPADCNTGRHLSVADESFGRLASKSWDMPDVWDVMHRMADREWFGEVCPGGEGSYCPSCNRWQGEHRGAHKR